MSVKEGMAYAPGAAAGEQVPVTSSGTTRKPRSSRVKGGSGRRQFSLGRDSLDRLATLKDSTGAASSSEVIRNALRVYEYLVQEESQGHKLLIEEADGKYIQLKML